MDSSSGLEAPSLNLLLDGSSDVDADCQASSDLSVSFPLLADGESGVALLEWGVARQVNMPLSLLDVLPLRSYDPSSLLPSNGLVTLTATAAANAISLSAGTLLYSVLRVTNGVGMSALYWSDGLLVTCATRASHTEPLVCICTANMACGQ